MQLFQMRSLSIAAEITLLLYPAESPNIAIDISNFNPDITHFFHTKWGNGLSVAYNARFLLPELEWITALERGLVIRNR